MGRAITAAAALAIVGAALYFAMFHGGAAGDAPGVADVLSAEHTAGIAGVQRLDELARQTEAALVGVPPEMLGDASAVLDPAKRAEALGFDPLTAEGWQSIGVDAAAGVHVALDARVTASGKPVPVLLLKVTDLSKLLALVEKRTGQKPEASTDGAVKTLKLGAKTVFFGERSGYTAVLLGDEALVGGGAKKGFEAFLTGTDAAISKAAPFKTAFGGANAPVLFWYGDLKGARALAAELKAPPQLTGAIDYYTGLFPGLAAWIGLEGTGFRLVASEKGAALLQKFFRPQRKGPDFAKYVPARGWAAVKVAVNLPQLLDAVAEALPPDLPEATQAKQGLQMGTLAMGVMLGVSWQQLGQAFSGHAAFALDLSKLERFPMGGFDAVAMLGVNDPKQADAVVETLLAKAKDSVPVPIVAKRVGDVVVLGTAPSVEAALARAGGEETLAGRPAGETLGDDVVYGATYDLTPLFGQVAAASPELKPLFESPALRKVASAPHVGFAVRLDRDGLLGESVGGSASLTTLIGALAAVAIPSFVKYTRRSKTAEARMNVSRIAQLALAFYQWEQSAPDGTVRPHRFPVSAKRTPTDPCRKGKTAGDDAWEAKGWRELGFSVEGPSRYTYEFISKGEGAAAQFTARAVGDLDCDGVLSTFERVGYVNASGKVELPGDTFIENETE